jgi:hypothetical protein
MKLERRNIFLLLAITFVGVLSYQLTIKNTFEYKASIDTLNFEQMQQKQEELLRLKRRQLTFEKRLDEKQVNRLGTEETLFKLLEGYESVKILDYDNEIFYEDNRNKKRYHQIQLKGSYKDLLSIIDRLLNNVPSLNIESLEQVYKQKSFNKVQGFNFKLIASEISKN